MSDLFELFKSQESKLHERPSEQVWQKLEQRLERRRKARRGIQFLQLPLVALVLLILLLAAALVWYFTQKG